MAEKRLTAKRVSTGEQEFDINSTTNPSFRPRFFNDRLTAFVSIELEKDKFKLPVVNFRMIMSKKVVDFVIRCWFDSNSNTEDVEKTTKSGDKVTKPTLVLKMNKKTNDFFKLFGVSESRFLDRVLEISDVRRLIDIRGIAIKPLFTKGQRARVFTSLKKISDFLARKCGLDSGSSTQFDLDAIMEMIKKFKKENGITVNGI